MFLVGYCVFLTLLSGIVAQLEAPRVSTVKAGLEEEVIDYVREFLDREQIVLDEMKHFYEHVKNIHLKVNENPEYKNDPRSIFLIVKRLITDWHYIFLQGSVHRDKFQAELQENLEHLKQDPDFPTLDNLVELVAQLGQAQELQKAISAKEFMRMVTNDANLELSASECSVVAQILRHKGKDKLAKIWEKEITKQKVLTDPLMELATVSFN